MSDSMVTLEIASDKIDHYLSKTRNYPLIIDAQNRNDIQSIKNRFRLGKNQFISIDNFMTPDGAIREEDVLKKIGDSKTDLFITGLAPAYMLYGRSKLKSILNDFIHLETHRHVIILTYQCKGYFCWDDPRLRNRYCIIEGLSDNVPDIVFIKGSVSVDNIFEGLNHMEEVVETRHIASCYIRTARSAGEFENSIYRISEINTSYSLLINTLPNYCNVPEEYGIPTQWDFAYEEYQKTNSWDLAYDKKFGNHEQLISRLKDTYTFTENENWFLLLGLKIYTRPNDEYLANAIHTSSSVSELIGHIYTDILQIEPMSPNFNKKYQIRKKLVNEIKDDLATQSFCNQIITEQFDSIYYLTDNTVQEKELIFQIINNNKNNFDRTHLIDALKIVYPDLSAYLAQYQFKDTFLTEYFTQYKYLKVINSISADFLNIVDTQSIEHDFYKLLDTRESVLDSIDKDTSQLFFIDALGVEYLSLIMEECKYLKLYPKIHICRCELPSITSCNKGFLSEFKESNIVSPKELDELKHHGHLDQDYQHTKLPIHIIDEIEILKKYLKKIKTTLLEGHYKKIIIISDHGASRLAVINEHETLIQMNSKGLHSGRCCLKSDIDDKPDYAIDAGDFWAIANYNRFKGGRKADVEVHGGATLEEVTIPIIELELLNKEINLKIITDDDNKETNIPVVLVSFRKKASFSLMSSTELDQPYVIIAGKKYEATQTKNKSYHIVALDLKKPGIYLVEVYSSGIKIEKDLNIRIENESGRERKIL